MFGLYFLDHSYIVMFHYWLLQHSVATASGCWHLCEWIPLNMFSQSFKDHIIINHCISWTLSLLYFISVLFSMLFQPWIVPISYQFFYKLFLLSCSVFLHFWRIVEWMIFPISVRERRAELYKSHFHFFTTVWQHMLVWLCSHNLVVWQKKPIE